MYKTNKRKYFRVYPHKPICSKLSVFNIKGTPINSRSTNVCIINIGANGLLFKTLLELTVSKDVVYLFEFNLLGETFRETVEIVREDSKSNGVFLYGATFLSTNDSSEQRRLAILNKLLVTTKRNKIQKSKKVCSTETRKHCPIYLKTLRNKHNK